MTRYLFLLLVLLPGALWAQGKPESAVLNGGFEWQGGWSLSAQARRVPADRGGLCLLVDGQSGVTQDLPTDGMKGIYTAAVDFKAEGVMPAGGAGYAYVAVYQEGADGKLVAFRDFGQATGTKDWQRVTYTFELAPQTVTLSLRCGIFNASGKAWFDNWTLVAGTQARTLDEVDQMNPAARPAQGCAAVLREPTLPVSGKPSDPERLGKLLQAAGLQVEYLSAADLADPRKLRPDRYHLVVLPYGQAFPAGARRNFIQYLHLGGSFISTGGYVFNQLWARQGEQWVDEGKLIAAELAEAMKRSILPDGGFEQTTPQAPGGWETDGRWRRDHEECTLDREGAHEGQVCAKVTAAPGTSINERKWYLNLPATPGATYRVSGWIKTKEVGAGGFAYLAAYEYGDNDKLLRHRDYAQVRGTHDWEQFTYDFTPGAGTTRLFLKGGLYLATGTAWFDDIRLCQVDRVRQQPMNTATGDPGDGLGIAAWQIGAFDASFPLRRVARVLPGGEQYLFGGGFLDAPLQGWAAAGVQGYDNARWVELLASRDRFGRDRGAAGALMLNYNGYFPGSLWAFFGAENRDLFDGQAPWLDRGLVETARFMVRGVFLRNLKTDQALYQDGETVKAEIMVQNNGGAPVQGTVTFAAFAAGQTKAEWTAQVPVTVRAGDAAPVECPWRPARFSGDTYRLRAVLAVGGQDLDEMTGGFMVERPQVRASGPTLRYRDNYLTLNGRPLFLFGSDTYANTYTSSTESPWTWHLDHIAARDYGFNLYENLQYCNAPQYTYTEREWRQFAAMAQSTQREGLVFMPCQLCGHDVAIGDELLEKQAAECEAYGQHMRDVPGLLYYLNGDFQFKGDDKTALTGLWNRWLTERYGSAEKLRAAWGEEWYGTWGEMAYPPPTSSRWDSVRRVDWSRFDIWLNYRWVQRHVAAVRQADKDHPITSEYYQRPYGPIDLILTIGDQDVSNIGYFDGPQRDLDNLPLTLRLNDLRARGKSVSLGEYGVKTHPAWALENGAGGYHPVRTEEEQQQLFMAVAHYGLGMGASKVQNWCLRDASEWVFPWGVFYPNGRVPKDVAYWHRNLSLVWRFFAPKYVPPQVSVMLPDGLRIGNGQSAGVDAAMNAFAALVDLNANFNMVNEQHAAALTDKTRVLIWPSPLCPDDAAYDRVKQWAQAGGKLLVTGDLSRDGDRQRTRAARLAELCGVEFVRELAAPPLRAEGGETEVTLGGQKLALRPAVEVKATTGKVEAATAAGQPLLVRHTLGQGEVLYCTDALELGARTDVLATLQALYATVIPATERVPGPEGMRISRQPLAGGGAFVTAFNTSLAPAPRPVSLPAGKTQAALQVAGRYPGFVATTGSGQVIAVGASGEAKLNGQALLTGRAQAMALALDGKSLPNSGAVLLCPFSTGTLVFQSRRPWQEPVTLLGDIRDGSWTTYETKRGRPGLAVDEDTKTCLVLVCERAERDRWIGLLNRALRRPWEIRGY